MATLDIARIHDMQCDAEILADNTRIYFTKVIWARCSDNVLRLLPRYNSWGQLVR